MEDVLLMYQDESNFLNIQGRRSKLEGFCTDLVKIMLPLASSSVLLVRHCLSFVQPHVKAVPFCHFSGYSFPSEGSLVM